MNSVEAKEPPVRKVPEHLFNYACEYLNVFEDVQCGNLESPWAVTSRATRGSYGLYYIGEDIIYISPTVNKKDYPNWNTVAVHESTHYILEKAGARVSMCQSEEIARRAHHSYAGVPYNDKWKTWYGCK